MKSSFLALLVLIPFIAAGSPAKMHGDDPAAGVRDEPETQTRFHVSAPLREFNSSLMALTRQVSPAVVQIMVNGYGQTLSKSRNTDITVVRRDAIGSGVILDPNGYIVTNAHVVKGAQHIRVTLAENPGSSPFDMPPIGKRKILEARVIGIDKDTDLALLKVDAHNLPSLTLGAARPVDPGELVLAIGSPEGLQSSVSMGVVSSVWRQPDPAEPMVYIQTDAPINPGNSGGPLIDLDGYVVGLNTFILTEGGGSEGLGFAIPARTVRFVYDDLRKYGHVHRTEIDASAQEITPTLAKGLDLMQDWGVVISDVVPQGLADQTGLKIGDIVYSVDGQQISGLPSFTAALYMHPSAEPLRLEVLRRSARISLLVPAVQHHDTEDDLADFIDPGNLIAHLGVFVHALDDNIRAALPDLRVFSGVVVVAQSPEPNSYISTLQAGDILYSLNQKPIESVQQLRMMLNSLRPEQAVVLQIGRAGKLQYVAFNWAD